MTEEERKQKNREKAKRYRERHPERAQDAVNRWREKNPDRVRTAMSNWRERNPDRVKDINKRAKRNTVNNYLDTANFRWEDVEGYDGWTVNTEVHHRLEMFGWSADELKAKGWYYNCTPDELLCISNSEHRLLHHYLTRISW